MLIPKEAKNIILKLEKAGFEAYIVGGCVRDFLLGREPQDWDVTTNAKPEEIRTVFPDSFYENNFLTVTVKTPNMEVEVTTYRLEAAYSDKRHPDNITFAKTIEADLSRRDFTVNAMAIGEKSQIPNPKSQTNSKFKILNSKLVLVDLFGGEDDLKKKLIRTVGNPNERFSEDALRMLRSVRFATTLGFAIEENTAEAIIKNSLWIEAVSKERIRDELVKIIMADPAKSSKMAIPSLDRGAGGPAGGIELLRQLNLLKFVLPELEENYGVSQNKHHIYDCYQHALKALEYAANKKFSLPVRLAALLHDVAKPRVKVGDGINSTFYNHEVVGAKMAFQMLQRLKFSNQEVENVARLVKWHMFYYNVDEVTESSVRRLARNVGPEHMEELLQVREADRIGSGVPKAQPYKLRHLKYIIDKVSKDPISVKMLKVNGKDVMDVLKIQPGPRVGQILDVLLGYVLDDPKKNTKSFLEKEITALGSLDEKKLKGLAEKSKEEKFEVQKQENEKIKDRYYVK